MRVEWLQANVPEDVHIHHVATVADFRVALARVASPAMVILDHDLGYDTPTGQDAADAMPDDFAAPVVIWSMNPTGAASMERTLRSKRIACARVPFNPMQLRPLLPVLLT